MYEIRYILIKKTSSTITVSGIKCDFISVFAETKVFNCFIENSVLH